MPPFVGFYELQKDDLPVIGHRINFRNPESFGVSGWYPTIAPHDHCEAPLFHYEGEEDIRRAALTCLSDDRYHYFFVWKHVEDGLVLGSFRCETLHNDYKRVQNKFSMIPFWILAHPEQPLVQRTSVWDRLAKPDDF